MNADRFPTRTEYTPKPLPPMPPNPALDALDSQKRAQDAAIESLLGGEVPENVLVSDDDLRALEDACAPLPRRSRAGALPAPFLNMIRC